MPGAGWREPVPRDLGPISLRRGASLGSAGRARRLRRTGAHHGAQRRANGSRRQLLTLAPDELIVEIVVPGPSGRSVYHKAMDRALFAYALASVAATAHVDGGQLHDVRIVVGGVANVPVRAHAAEALVEGQTGDADLFRRAGAAAVEGAHPLRQNAYKLPLVRNLVTQALGDLLH